jgi:hypothetical protein
MPNLQVPCPRSLSCKPWMDRWNDFGARSYSRVDNSMNNTSRVKRCHKHPNAFRLGHDAKLNSTIIG